MCTVSMVYDFAHKLPPQVWNPVIYNDFSELIRKLDEIDRKLGLPDCHDPKKAEFMKSVEERLKRLEDQRADDENDRNMLERLKKLEQKCGHITHSRHADLTCPHCVVLCGNAEK